MKTVIRTPLVVEQVVDVVTYTVQVTLDPAEIIEALAEAMRGNAEKLMLIRALPAEHSSRRQAFAELRTLLADVFAVTLTPGQAEALGGELYEATTLPDQCVHCESFGVVKVEGLELCHRHAGARDAAAQVSS